MVRDDILLSNAFLGMFNPGSIPRKVSSSSNRPRSQMKAKSLEVIPPVHCSSSSRVKNWVNGPRKVQKFKKLKKLFKRILKPRHFQNAKAKILHLNGPLAQRYLEFESVQCQMPRRLWQMIRSPPLGSLGVHDYCIFIAIHCTFVDQLHYGYEHEDGYGRVNRMLTIHS